MPESIVVVISFLRPFTVHYLRIVVRLFGVIVWML